MNIIYNSMLAKYNSKLCALKTGENIKISIFAEDVHSVKIRFNYLNDSFVFEMQQDEKMWSYDFIAPQVPCIVWYSFIIEADCQNYYLGTNLFETQGEGQLFTKTPKMFQLTVYDRNFKTPDWSKKATMYQIFPDRFCRGNSKNLQNGKDYHLKMGRNIIIHQTFDESPTYEPIGSNNDYSPCDFFGGDLEGIERKLDYLKELSVDLIYLNPISEAESNHRYDTADYMRVDPFLGSNYDFSHLCRAAKEKGIKIILDGVYSHTGSDSIYFNIKQNYQSVGAYQNEDSDYYGWYSFNGSRDNYKSWWGFKTLPEVNELNTNWQQYIYKGKNGVFYNWLNMGATGFRLDVADELPDEIIAQMRDSLKLYDNDNFLLGEVWEDATSKQSYGKEREYALGFGLDSVMNYPFRGNALNFFLEKINANELCLFLSAQRINYPLHMYYCLMNMLSSHDVPRSLTLLSSGVNGENMSREEQAKFSLSRLELIKGKKRLQLATVLQFAIPGIPSIYYGDEQGIVGLKDPFNRAPFKENDNILADFFRQISALRKNEPLLLTGHVSFLALSEDVIAVLRYQVFGKDILQNGVNKEAIIVLINRGHNDFEADIGIAAFCYCITEAALDYLKNVDFNGAYDIIHNCKLSYENRKTKISIKGQSFGIIKLV